MATTPPPKKPAVKKPAPPKAAQPTAPAPKVESPTAQPDVQHAPLEAPKPRPTPPPAPPAPQAADMAVDLLVAGRSERIVCETTGELAKPDCMFTDPVNGLVTAKCRLLETGASMSGRRITRLLVGQGSTLTATAAARLAARAAELNKD